MAIPEGGFKDEKGLRAWLESLPEEQRTQFTRVLLHRAALRVLPFVADINLGLEKPKNAILLTTFVMRANEISRVARTYPTKKIQLVATAVAGTGFATQNPIYGGAIAAFFAASTAAGTIVSKYPSALPLSAFAAADFIHATTIWDALSNDARKLEERDYADGFQNTPLWPDGEPDWWQRQIGKLYDLLMESLNSGQSGTSDPNSWSVWLDWYDAIVDGHSPWRLPRTTANELEKRIALGDGRDDFWDTDKRSVAEINAEIAGWVEEARALQRVEPEVSEEMPESGERIQKADNWKGEPTPVAIPPNSITDNRLAVRIQVGGLRSTVAAERTLLGNKPNDPLRLDEWERKRELFDKLDSGLAAVEANLPVEADGKPKDEDQIAAGQLEALANEFRNWLNTNRPEMVDWALRLGSASLFIGLMSFLGATMPVATSVILAMTCGTKARDVILGKRKEKEDEKAPPSLSSFPGLTRESMP